MKLAASISVKVRDYLRDSANLYSSICTLTVQIFFFYMQYCRLGIFHAIRVSINILCYMASVFQHS